MYETENEIVAFTNTNEEIFVLKSLIGPELMSFVEEETVLKVDFDEETNSIVSVGVPDLIVCHVESVSSSGSSDSSKQYEL